MRLYISVFVYLSVLLVKCDEIKDMCNFLDTKVQPNTYRLLSKSILPDQVNNAKGEAGRIGVIGGSVEYTGAPYFSAITAMKACIYLCLLYIIQI